jgi:hypothetical protein
VKFSKSSRYIGIAVVLVVVTVLALRQYAIYDLKRGDAQAALSRARSAVEQARVTASSLPLGSPRDVTGGTEPIAIRLRRVYQTPSIRASIAQLTNTDDPTMAVHAMHWVVLCTNIHISDPLTPDSFIYDKKLTEAQRIEMAHRHNKSREAPPPRLQFPEPWAGILNKFALTGAAQFDPELEKALEIAVIAPMTEREAATRAKLITDLKRDCKGAIYQSEDTVRSREVRAHWAARGATSALYQNKDYGWTSNSLRELNDQDYALIERIINERQPDGLAKLLNGFAVNAVFDIEAIEQNSAMLMAVAAQMLVPPIAACKLGLDDCSSDNPRFKNICLTHGGCDQPDIPSLLRYISARDGFDPNWLDKQVETLIQKIREGDLAALGIRRKKQQ